MFKEGLANLGVRTSSLRRSMRWNSKCVAAVALSLMVTGCGGYPLEYVNPDYPQMGMLLKLDCSLPHPGSPRRHEDLDTSSLRPLQR